MKKWSKLLAVFLSVVILLSGCMSPEMEKLFFGTPYSEMTYTRPDMQQFQQTLDRCCETARTSEEIDTVMDAVWDFYDAYDRFCTDYNLSYIGYCRDVTDTYWEAEQEFCAENSAQVEAGLDTFYRALAQSPLRETLETEDYFGADFFDAYEGESVYDEEFMALMEQEAQLEEQYYELWESAAESEVYSEAFYTDHAGGMAQLFAKLVALRRQIAKTAGYDSYTEFAGDYYHYRDYSPQQMVTYFNQVSQQMQSLYWEVDESAWAAGEAGCSAQEAFDYLHDATKAMGGDLEKVFSRMARLGLYDIDHGKNKYDIGFEMYLPSYNVPYIFICPYGTQYDKLAFAHEFGHFANDYLCSGSAVGTDVAEVHSQAMEYLSLCYTDQPELEVYKVADCLDVYYAQSAYCLFELQVYDLEEVTPENISALYDQVMQQFGFPEADYDPLDYVTVSHYFVQPMYIPSYVLSNDLAFQIYQKEKQTKGAGLDLYKESLLSNDAYLLTFAEAYGLESPFAQGRIESVCQTFREILLDA